MFPKFIISFPSNCFANNISLMMRNNNGDKIPTRNMSNKGEVFGKQIKHLG